MYDRNVEFPQRYRLQKVDGTDDIFDLIPTPGEIRNEGTLINKSSLLKDTTAALFGLGSGAVPDDVLNQLGGLANYYIWRKSTLSEPASYTLGPEHELTMFDNMNLAGGDTKSFQYSSNVSVSSDGITISLNSPSSVQIKQNYGGTISAASVLYGKFVSVNNSIYFYPADCVVTGNYVSSSSTPVIASKAQLVSGVAAQYETSYVFSPERNKYPDDGESVGSTYEYMGQLGDKARVVTGSYTGTNKYGSGNKNTLTFPFEPKLVIVGCLKNEGTLLVLFNGATETTCNPGNSNSTYLINVEWSGNTIKWYGRSAVYQMNNHGTTYEYIAIG